MEAVAFETFEVEIAGKKRTVTAMELVVHSIQRMAARPSPAAAKYLGELQEKYGSAPEPTLANRIVVPEPISIEEWRVQALATQQRLSLIPKEVK